MVLTSGWFHSLHLVIRSWHCWEAAPSRCTLPPPPTLPCTLHPARQLLTAAWLAAIQGISPPPPFSPFCDAECWVDLSVDIVCAMLSPCSVSPSIVCYWCCPAWHRGQCHLAASLGAAAADRREKSAVAAVAAETRKNMRRHFSVHNISFIARHQHQGVQWALCLHDQLNSGEQRSVVSDTRAGPQLVFYTQILLKQFWAGLPSSHHTGHWVLAWRFHHFAMMIVTRHCRAVVGLPSPPTLDILDSRLMQWGFIMSSSVTFCEHPRPFN